MEIKLSDLQVKNAALEKQRMSNRLVFLDDLKGLCILLVVFCHFVLLPADSVAGNIIMSICWVAVPCFIMTTGYLLHKKETFDWKRYFTRLVTTAVKQSQRAIENLIVFRVGWSAWCGSFTQWRCHGLSFFTLHFIKASALPRFL